MTPPANVDFDDRAHQSLTAQHERLGLARFPGSRQAQELDFTSSMQSMNLDEGHQSRDDPFVMFFFTSIAHTTFDPEWPIEPNWPAMVRGVRSSLGLSQAAFAERCGFGRASVERWETGQSAPLHGNALQLLSAIRPHLSGPLQAGQALNFAAAAVLPQLAQPTARYTGAQIKQMLRAGADDHTDLALNLLAALVDSHILVVVETGRDELDSLYIPLAGRLASEAHTPGWLPELREHAEVMTAKDRGLLLSLARRLARR